MPTVTASEARANLYRLMAQAAESHQPIAIKGKRSDAVLVSAEDWQAIQETLHVSDYVLWLKFDDGAEGEVDLTSELHGEIFEPLKDEHYFR